MRILYFGMFGEFSLIPLELLVTKGFQICGVVVPAAAGENSRGKSIWPILTARRTINQIPVLSKSTANNIVQFASDHEIPAFAMDRPNSHTAIASIGQLEPDLALVACFSLILPLEMLEIPPFGFLNLHPSLLPQFRGPDPLFWTFRQGQLSSGVTIHHLDEGIDSGPIALQRSLVFPDGISGSDAERQCAQLGAELFAEAIKHTISGTLPRLPQHGKGSYFPAPSAADFQISTSWSARRAYNFMRGTEHWRQAYPIEIGGFRLLLRHVTGFIADETLDEPWIRQGKEVRIQMSPGVLNATVC